MKGFPNLSSFRVWDVFFFVAKKIIRIKIRTYIHVYTGNHLSITNVFVITDWTFRGADWYLNNLLTCCKQVANKLDHVQNVYLTELVSTPCYSDNWSHNATWPVTDTGSKHRWKFN